MDEELFIIGLITCISVSHQLDNGDACASVSRHDIIYTLPVMAFNISPALYDLGVPAIDIRFLKIVKCNHDEWFVHIIPSTSVILSRKMYHCRQSTQHHYVTLILC